MSPETLTLIITAASGVLTVLFKFVSTKSQTDLERRRDNHTILMDTINEKDQLTTMYAQKANEADKAKREAQQRADECMKSKHELGNRHQELLSINGRMAIRIQTYEACSYTHCPCRDQLKRRT
ncbi:MAG: hypothetical protein AAF267_19195 [Deinococcota bacterium]